MNLKLTDEELNREASSLNWNLESQQFAFRDGARFAESRLLPMIKSQEWRKYDPKDESTWPKEAEFILTWFVNGMGVPLEFKRTMGLRYDYSFTHWHPAPPPPIDHEREEFEAWFDEMAKNGAIAREVKEACFASWQAARKEGK